MATRSEETNPPLQLTEEELADVRLLIESFGEHVNLGRFNQAFIAHESELSDADYRGLLAVNLFDRLGQIRRSPDLISQHEKEWIFQSMGYLGIDPRKVLRDERFAKLKR